MKTKSVIPPAERCWTEVRLPGRQGWGSHKVRCQRRGVVECFQDGVKRRFCKQHDPEAAQARRKKRSRVWKLESELHAAESAQSAAEQNVLAAVRANMHGSTLFFERVGALRAADRQVELARKKLDLFKGGE